MMVEGDKFIVVKKDAIRDSRFLYDPNSFVRDRLRVPMSQLRERDRNCPTRPDVALV